MISAAQYEAMEEFAVRSDNYARVLEDVVAMMGFERMMEIHDILPVKDIFANIKREMEAIPD